MGKQIDSGKRSTATSRHLRWESFESRIREGPPSLEPIKGTPRVVLFIAPGGTQIGIRFYTKDVSSFSSPLAEVAVRKVGWGPEERLEVSTGNPDLFRDFYALCCTVADRIQIDHQPVASALADTLRAWAALLRRKSLLSTDRQVGLFGELLFLKRVSAVVGWASAVGYWQGPSSEEHDFTLMSVDVEVKSTRGEKRIHEISSLTQLVPKNNRQLFVASIQLTPSAGKDSFSLSELIALVFSEVIKTSPRSVDNVRQQLSRQGWADEDAAEYVTRYQLRTRMAAVPVDAAFPAIVPETLMSLWPDRISRIQRVAYAVNLDGLGVLDGTKKFDRLLFPR